MHDDPAREHPAFRRWLVGLAGGMLLLLLLLPDTGWLIREHVRLQIVGLHLDQSPAAVGRVAARMPDDPQVQIAAATLTDRGMVPLLALPSRFPGNPAVLATLLRYFTRSQVRINREDEVEYLQGKHPSHRKPATEPEVPADFDRIAAEGEQQDPDNAYFPTMRAAGDFAAHRDDEALAGVLRAGGCSRWDDYIQQEAIGRERITDTLTGHPSSIPTTAVDAAILFPHLAAIRRTASLATYRAVKTEESGSAEEGFRIRLAVAHTGELMRAQGPSMITALVGAAMVQLAQMRPGGEFTPEPARSPSTGNDAGDEIERRRVNRFCTYLEAHGHAHEARWFREELRAAVETRQIAQAGTDASAWGNPFRKLSLFHAADALLLSNVLWMGLAGLAGAGLCRTRRIAAGQPLPAPVQRNIGIAVLGALLLCAAVVSQPLRWSDYGTFFSLAIILSMLATVVYAAVFRKRRLPELVRAVGISSAVGLVLCLLIPTPLSYLGLAAIPIGIGVLLPRKWSAVRAIGWAPVIVAAPVAVGAAVAWQTRGPQGLVSFGTMLLTSAGDQTPWWANPGAIAAVAVAVPVLSALLLAGFSLIWRVPLTVGLSRGFRGAALPVCCLLLIGFGGTVLATSVQETRVLYGLHRMVEHDGTYLAELLGRQWPGLVR